MSFNRNNLCPNCGSGTHIPKGRNERCWGRPYEDGFICTREEFKSNSPVDTGGWFHFYDRCSCRRGHGNSLVSSIMQEEIQRSRKVNREYAIHIWDESISINDPNCKARLYLTNTRGIDISSDQLRYHSGLTHFSTAKQKHTVLIARVSDINNRTIAIQRIYLDNQQKANLEPNKMTLGSPIGGAVKLRQPENGVLGICEGIETGLSVQQLTNTPVWVALGSTFMSAIDLPPPGEVKTIKVFTDGDEAGTQAYEKFYAKYKNVYNVENHQAPPGKDYNDVLTDKKKAIGL